MSITIREIEAITYQEAENICEEATEIKHHACFFVDFGEPFGYSVLVFKNGNHIYYANDYSLHYRETGKAELREKYIEKLNRILFTENEIMSPVSSYKDYIDKEYYVHNYWIMQFDHLSFFCFDDEREKRDKKKNKYPFICGECFCYVKDESITEKAKQFIDHLNDSYAELCKSDEIFREMIRYELANHEAGYTGSAMDALRSLRIDPKTLPENRRDIIKEELRRQIELSW